MPCNDPLVAWKSNDKTARGLRAVTFDIKKACIDLPINLPCSKCYGCRNDKAREWALRCSHEAQLHDQNSFLTLTYETEPKTKSGTPTLRPRDFTLFMKKLRKKRQQRISFFQAGEYGSLGRPHHHCLVFNCGFTDMYLWRKEGNHNLYRSEELEKLWKQGHAEIGSVTFESAGYVAGYTMKDPKDAENTRQHCEETNRITTRVPEYRTMSKRPAIGKRWITKYIKDVYPTDEVITKNGNKLRPPRYYDQQLEITNPELLQQLKAERRANLTDEQLNGLRRMAKDKILRSQSRERRNTL